MISMVNDEKTGDYNTKKSNCKVRFDESLNLFSCTTTNRRMTEPPSKECDHG